MVRLEGRFAQLDIRGTVTDHEVMTTLKLAANTPYAKGAVITAYPFAHMKQYEARGMGLWAEEKDFNTNIIPVDIGCGVTTADWEGPVPTEDALHDCLKEAIYDTKLQEYLGKETLFFGPKVEDFKTLETHFIEIGKKLDGSLQIGIHAGSGQLGWAARMHYSRPQQKPGKKETWQYINDALEIRRITTYFRAAVLASVAKKFNAKLSTWRDSAHNSIWYSSKFIGLYRGATEPWGKGEAHILLGKGVGIARVKACSNATFTATYTPKTLEKLGLKDKKDGEFAAILDAELRNAHTDVSVIDVAHPVVSTTLF